VYDQGYPPRQQQILVQPPVEYIQAEPSDLGMGLRDAGKVARHHGTDYGAGYGRPELSGYGGAPGYGAAAYGPAGHEDVSYTTSSLSDFLMVSFSIRLCY